MNYNIYLIKGRETYIFRLETGLETEMIRYLYHEMVCRREIDFDLADFSVICAEIKRAQTDLSSKIN